jgi:hypothetical protein
METQSVSTLSAYLAEQRRVWLRLAALRLEGDWKLALLEVTVGEAPPRWRRQRWVYERAIFVALKPAGATIARWLERGRVSLPSLSIQLAVEGSGSIERRDSNFQGIYEQLPWPTRESIVRVSDSSGHTIHDELVAADTPAFIGFDQAAGAFFGVPPMPNRNFSGCEIVVREQDRRARIERVRVHPTHLLVEIGGKNLRGVSLTLSGAAATSRRLSSRTREVRLPAPGGLDADAWLALHRDRELLDRRVLNPTWGASSQDVEIAVDSSTRIEVLISGGEQATVEFKREIPQKDPVVFLRTVAAFANGMGGTILFGVADDGEIVGIGDGQTRKDRDRLTSLISDWVRPLPHFESERVDIAGHGVIALNVAPGNQVPYGVGTSDRGVRFYVRRAGNTFPASPTDVRALVHSRIPSESPAPYFPRSSPRL